MHPNGEEGRCHKRAWSHEKVDPGDGLRSVRGQMIATTVSRNLHSSSVAHSCDWPSERGVVGEPVFHPRSGSAKPGSRWFRDMRKAM